jgi:trk system potassium uptake protein TrkA
VKEKAMRVLILGCGRVGSLLANMLSREGHGVVILDKNADSFRRLEPQFAGEKFTGTGIDEEVLRKAGIESADAFIAVTNGDNTNVMVAQIAQRKFRVPRVIARVYDPIRAQTYQQHGLETLCTSIIGTGVLHDLLLGQPQKSLEDYVNMSPAVGATLPQLEDGKPFSGSGKEEA